jgi:hypothetical protein
VNLCRGLIRVHERRIEKNVLVVCVSGCVLCGCLFGCKVSSDCTVSTIPPSHFHDKRWCGKPYFIFLSYFYKQPPRFVYVYVVVSCMCCEKTGKRNHSWSSNKIIMISIIWASSSRSAGNWTTQPSLQLGFHQLDILVKMGQSSSISDVGWYWWDERLEMTPDELTQGQL